MQGRGGKQLLIPSLGQIFALGQSTVLEYVAYLLTKVMFEMFLTTNIIIVVVHISDSQQKKKF